MCIYCNTTKYRKIYENHNGPTPKDKSGRSYHIHHKDGNRQNNSPDNLLALSIQEHFDLHMAQGDYSSCWLLGKQMGMSIQQQSELMSKAASVRVTKGTHPFQRRADGSSLASDMVIKGNHPLQRRPDGGSSTMDRVKNGTNPFCRRPDGSSIASEAVANGTHHFVKRKFVREDNSQYKSTLLTFVNTDGRIEKDITQCDMRKKYQLNQGNLSSMVAGRYGYKSVNGWSLR